MGLERVERREPRIFTDVYREAFERRFWNEHAGIVQDELAYGIARHCSHEDPEQTAHRSTYPGQLSFAAGGDARDERRHIRHVLNVTIIAFLLEPVAAAASGNIGTDHAQVIRQRVCEV